MSEGNGSSSCFICFSNQNILTCHKCNRPYCPEHTSPIDTSTCSVCVRLVDTSIRVDELIDEEGKKHAGRKIVLTGEFWMRQRIEIANLTDIELEARLKAFQESVHEAELVLDVRRVLLNQHQHEKAERYGRSRSRLRLIKKIDTVRHEVAGKNQNERVENIQNAFKAASKMTIGGKTLTKEQIAQILLTLTKKTPPEVKP